MLSLPRVQIELGTVLVATALLWPACSVNVKKNEKGQEQKVDINTPVGGIHVDTDADVRDTGLTVYPGARLREKEDNNEKSANVNLSSAWGGLRVVAVEYESDDAPEKVISFYRGQLKKYGEVLQCRTHRHGANVEFHKESSDGDSKLWCEENDGGDNLELKVGTRDNQRIVSVEPSGKGTNFALVRLQVRGKDTI